MRSLHEVALGIVVHEVALGIVVHEVVVGIVVHEVVVGIVVHGVVVGIVVHLRGMVDVAAAGLGSQYLLVSQVPARVHVGLEVGWGQYLRIVLVAEEDVHVLGEDELMFPSVPSGNGLPLPIWPPHRSVLVVDDDLEPFQNWPAKQQGAGTTDDIGQDLELPATHHHGKEHAHASGPR